MFYETARGDHGLPYDPIKSCVVPRPIGWISTLSAAGVPNLAPYSFFNLVATNPALVVYGSNGRTPFGDKDTLTNIAATGEFVVNIATWQQRDAMFRSSAVLPPDVDEFVHAGLATLASRLIKPPRVAGAPIHLECTHHQSIELPSDDPGGRNVLVIGRVVGVHIDDAVIDVGRIDLGRIQPIARLGYGDYARVDTIFSMGVAKSAPRGP